MSINVVATLLPPCLVAKLVAKNKSEFIGERGMCSLADLILNVIKRTTRPMKDHHYKAFDANPGDGGCQNQALEIRRLALMDLRGELKRLEETACKLQKLVSKRKGHKQERDKMPPQKFFQKHFRGLTVSKEMEYLLLCCLLKVTRRPYRTHANGVVMTKSDFSCLSKLSKGMDKIEGDLRRKIVEVSQKKLSLLNMDTIRVAAAKQPPLTQTMLSEANTKMTTPEPKYEPKAIGCLFYEVKVVMQKLRDEKATICLKSIVPKGKTPFFIFFQPKTEGGKFEVVTDVEDNKAPLIVFETIFKVDKERTIKRLAEDGFTETVLICSAQDTPSKDIEVEKAKDEIRKFGYKDLQIKKFLELDHVYCTTFDDEKKGRK